MKKSAWYIEEYMKRNDPLEAETFVVVESYLVILIRMRHSRDQGERNEHWLSKSCICNPWSINHDIDMRFFMIET